ncbi:menaquinone reductase, multiheme cytochrome c subunit [Candidatus Magnetomoraceae bacterium gMMP-15]
MSTADDKPKQVEEQETECKCKGASPTCLTSVFVVGVALSIFFGWVIFPKLLYSQKRQPIDYNHAIHLDLVDDGCTSCHYFREDGSFSGIPKLDNCAECHEEVQGESQEEVKLVEKYVTPGREIPWLVYSKQLNCVFFSHAAHVKKAEMDCTTCHGHIGESTNTRVYEENRFTGVSRDIWGANIAGLKKHTWDRMKMDDCAECHLETSGRKDACFVCHK